MLTCEEWPTGDVYPFTREIKLTQKKKKKKSLWGSSNWCLFSAYTHFGKSPKYKQEAVGFSYI